MVVIGGRCAGATTAILLARQGVDVMVVDRVRLPSEIPHGHFIHRHGPSRLQKWGLLDRVLDTGCPAVTSITSDFGDGPLFGEGLEVDGAPVGLGPRRAALDGVLLDAAIESGATFREGFAVRELEHDGDRVAGVRDGRGELVSARYVVGADGRNSGVARQVAALAYEEAPTATCWYFSYWSGVAGDGLEIYVRDRRMIFAFPTNDGLFAIFVAWRASELDSVRADIEGSLMAAVDAVPDLAARVRGGRREERFYGATQLPNFLRKPFGPGWALVGDAGCHKDPYLALGVCDALRDADLLAEAIAAALSGQRPEDEAFAAYEQARNVATLADYHMNLAGAQFLPSPPELVEQRIAARASQEAANRYYLRVEGLIE